MNDDYRAFVFDVDGTLVVSKTPMTALVAAFLEGLLRKGKIVGIISGGKFSILEANVLSRLGERERWGQLFVMPTVGASLHEWKDGAWRQVYANPVTHEEFGEIQKAFDTAFMQTSFPRPEAKWGEQIEYRNTQVTFSAFGQTAPVEAKQGWDPDNAKKQELVRLLESLLPTYAVKAGGMTSIDVTHAGIDKQYGIERFMAHTGLAKEDILFVGDALYEGGNDHVVLKTGVDVCQVADPDDMLKQLSRFVAA